MSDSEARSAEASPNDAGLFLNSSPLSSTAAAAPAAVLPGRTPAWIALDAERLGRFGVTSLQLGLVLLVLHTFRIAESSGLLDLTWLVFFGFVAHAALPVRYRPPCFLAFSFAVFWILLGVNALALVAGGLVLIGVCHLPVSFQWRVAMLLGIGVALALLRGAWVPWQSRTTDVVVPVLASMFIFRLMIYMYDIRHEREPVSAWRRLSYFFLPLNACFLLFPVVDYQTYRRSDHSGDSLETYQSGVLSIFRGVTHIILYRVVYQYLIPAPWVDGFYFDVPQLALYVVTAWLIYLNVSGTFHIIVGSMRLFGFNLPPVTHLYFLASGPNDLWRRGNIYWKDFMMKVFYYPTFKHFQKRKFSLTASLVLATVGVFVVTWLLHSYQWFWVLGQFPLAWIDVSFWTIFAVLVVGNSLWELNRGKRRSVGRKAVPWSTPAALLLGGKVVAMFLFMSLMWSWWSTRDTEEWLWAFAGPKTMAGGLLLVSIVAGILALGVLFQYARWRGLKLPLMAHAASYWHSVAATSFGTAFLLIAGLGDVQGRLTPEIGGFVASLQSEKLNARDEDLLNRSYYSTLLEPALTMWDRQVSSDRPRAQEMPLWVAGGMYQLTHDARYLEMRPSFENADGTISTNQWGMRDKEYTLRKPPNTLRIALLGSRAADYFGVAQPEKFDAVLEDRLNKEHAAGPYAGYEILNFGLFKYSVLQQAILTDQKVFRFEPDVLMIVGHPELDFAIDLLIRTLDAEIALPEPVQRFVAEAGVRPGMDPSEVRRRLLREPFPARLYDWGYRKIVEACRQHGVIPVWVAVSEIHEPGKRPPRAELESLLEQARNAGFVILDITDAFDGHAMPELTVREDLAPNTFAHRLLADRLYEELRERDSELGLGLNGERTTVGPRQ